MRKNYKVGILSLYYNNRNYGGLLQAYALQKYISSMGIDCEQICYNSMITEKSIRLLRIKTQRGVKKIKSILRYVEYQLRALCNCVLNCLERKNLHKRIDMFNKFQNHIPHSEEIYTEKTIIRSVEKYDVFICGSDVIWNAGIDSYISALGFVPDNLKKFAYGPSIGGNVLPNGWINKYEKYLFRLDAVSVREATIQNCLCEQLPELEVETVADPTFLLDKAEWEQELPSTKVEKQYVFCYLLGSSVGQRKQIKKWASTNGFRIITFPHIENNKYRTCDGNFGDIRDFISNPLEFVNLIKYAEIVITDSFHAVVFSLIFHSNFRALNRSSGERQIGMSGRIQNILKEVGMEELLVDDEEIQKIDNNIKLEFDYSDYVIAEKRRVSKEYILRNLERET